MVFIKNLIMLLLIMLYSTCLCITDKKMSGLNSNQPWSPQFQLKPSLLISLKVKSDDVISNWPGRIFIGFHNLMVGLWRLARYAYDKKQWGSCQIRKIAGCACTGYAGNVFPTTCYSDPDMHHDTYVRASRTCRDTYRDR